MFGALVILFFVGFGARIESNWHLMERSEDFLFNEAVIIEEEIEEDLDDEEYYYYHEE